MKSTILIVCLVPSFIIYCDSFRELNNRKFWVSISVEAESSPDAKPTGSKKGKRSTRALASETEPFRPQSKFEPPTKPEFESQKIYNPCADGIFQYGFDSEIALISFLNAALNFTEENQIEGIDRTQSQLPSSNVVSDSSYSFTVDVRCRTKNGRHFLVEMQNDFREDYHFKALVEHSRLIGSLDLAQTDEDKRKRQKKKRQGQK
jgi:hypothetical protein